MSYKIIDTIHIRGLQSFDKYEKLNQIEIKRDGNQILKILQRYQKGYKFRFILKVSYSAPAFQMKQTFFVFCFFCFFFVTCNGLNNTRCSLINSKSFRIVVVIHLKQIKNWDVVKGKSKWISTILADSDYPLYVDHFVFGFKTTTYDRLLQFSFSPLNEKAELITFKTEEKRYQY